MHEPNGYQGIKTYAHLSVDLMKLKQKARATKQNDLLYVLNMWARVTSIRPLTFGLLDPLDPWNPWGDKDPSDPSTPRPLGDSWTLGSLVLWKLGTWDSLGP